MQGIFKALSQHFGDPGACFRAIGDKRVAYSSSSSDPLGRETSSSSSTCFLLRLDIENVYADRKQLTKEKLLGAFPGGLSRPGDAG